MGHPQLHAGEVQSHRYQSPTLYRVAAPGAAEMITVYFEDSKVHPRLLNSAVQHSLWRFTKRHDAAFRAWSVAQLGQLTPDAVPAMQRGAHECSDAALELMSAHDAPSAPSTQEPSHGDCCSVRDMQHHLARGSLAKDNKLLYTDVQAALQKCHYERKGGGADMTRRMRRAAGFMACAIFASCLC